MKKQWIATIAVISCLCMAACGSGEGSTSTSTNTSVSSGSNSSGGTSTNTTQEGTSAPEATKAPEKVNPVYQFEMKLDGTTYEFPMWASKLESKGWKCKEDLTEELSPEEGTTVWWEKDGVTYMVDMYNVSADTLPLSKCAVSGIRTDDDYYASDSMPDIVLPENIKLGTATRENIVAAYGEPADGYESSEDHYVMYYDLDRHQYVHLTMISDVLTEVEIRNRVAMEGAGDEVSYAIPDMVENYKAPTVAGDVTNMVVTIDKVSYELPCPVAEFMENDFVLLPEYWNLVIPSDSSDKITFRYGNITIECDVMNFAKYATAVQNCFVTKITAEKYGYLQPLQLSVLGGIKLGMAETELESYLSGFTYEKEKSSHEDFVGNTYTISNPDHATQKYFIMINPEGEVSSISISKYEAPAYGIGEATAKNFDIKNIPVTPENSIYAFWMNKDGDEFRLPVKYSEMEKMGWKLKVQEEDPTTLNPGEELYSQLWKKDNITLYTVLYNPADVAAPLNECQVIEIMVSENESIDLFTEYNGTFMLPGGIRLFASAKDDIIKAYGEPSYYYESDIYYHLRYFTGSDRYTDLYVSKETGKLNKVEMSNKITWE